MAHEEGKLNDLRAILGDDVPPWWLRSRRLGSVSWTVLSYDETSLFVVAARLQGRRMLAWISTERNSPHIMFTQRLNFQPFLTQFVIRNGVLIA